MYRNVLTTDPAAVSAEVQAIYLDMFPTGESSFVPQVFGWATECFTGRHPGYQAIDAKYHDLEHTMQGALCMARILHQRSVRGTEPAIPRRLFELGMIAILLHDTGYLKKQGDTVGTGAKYTAIHVRRSAEFAFELLSAKGFKPDEISAVQNMIFCTGLNASLDKIPFRDEAERTTGFALGAADLIGQMAADDYIEKLPVLYSEFAEAASFDSSRTNSVGAFTSADDLMQKTPLFWEKYVKPKLDKDFNGLHHFLDGTGEDGGNFYMQRVEANIEQLRKLLAARLGKPQLTM